MGRSCLLSDRFLPFSCGRDWLRPDEVACSGRRREEAGWDVDFYAGCVYQRTRTPEEFRKLLNGELPVGEVYLEDDPPRMYKVLRQTKKPCFAFKVLAAGRINRPDDLNKAFRLAFESIKPTDCIFVGMFPRTKNEVRENVEYVHKILKGNS